MLFRSEALDTPGAEKTMKSKKSANAFSDFLLNIKKVSLPRGKAPTGGVNLTLLGEAPVPVPVEEVKVVEERPVKRSKKSPSGVNMTLLGDDSSSKTVPPARPVPAPAVQATTQEEAKQDVNISSELEELYRSEDPIEDIFAEAMNNPIDDPFLDPLLCKRRKSL